MARNGVEAQLEEATQEFVRRILGILRNASLAEVAAVGVEADAAPLRPHGSTSSGGSSRMPTFSAPRGPGRKPRQKSDEPSADSLAPKIMDALAGGVGPVPARTLAERLGVSLDALAKPLKQLRDEGRVIKRGEKRASKYSLPG